MLCSWQPVRGRNGGPACARQKSRQRAPGADPERDPGAGRGAPKRNGGTRSSCLMQASALALAAPSRAARAHWYAYRALCTRTRRSVPPTVRRARRLSCITEYTTGLPGKRTPPMLRSLHAWPARRAPSPANLAPPRRPASLPAQHRWPSRSEHRDVPHRRGTRRGTAAARTQTHAPSSSALSASQALLASAARRVHERTRAAARPGIRLATESAAGYATGKPTWHDSGVLARNWPAA